MLLIFLRIGIVLLCAGGLAIELAIALPAKQRQRLGLRAVSWLTLQLRAMVRRVSKYNTTGEAYPDASEAVSEANASRSGLSGAA
jgi:hypothetical protein